MHRGENIVRNSSNSAVYEIVFRVIEKDRRRMWRGREKRQVNTEVCVAERGYQKQGKGGNKKDTKEQTKVVSEAL